MPTPILLPDAIGATFVVARSLPRRVGAIYIFLNMTLHNGKDNFPAGMEKEVCVFESFWEGTEVGVGFIE